MLCLSGDPPKLAIEILEFLCLYDMIQLLESTETIRLYSMLFVVRCIHLTFDFIFSI